MRKLIVLFVLIGFGPAHADSYYNILKNQFNAASGKITDADIDVVGDSEAKTCVETSVNAPDEQRLVHIRRFTKIQQGRGPLLPDTKEVRVIYSEVVEPDLAYYIESVTTTFTRTEIKSLQTRPTKIELTVRKKDGYLFFRKLETVDTSSTTRITKYGYCFDPTVAPAAIAD
jgi:hypothetical protein